MKTPWMRVENENYLANSVRVFNEMDIHLSYEIFESVIFFSTFTYQKNC